MMEVEEIIEAKLVELLAAALPGWNVIGALSPAADGEVKQSPDTYISVFVDQASQDLDWRGPGVPCAYSARVNVYFSTADDATGAIFRNACRAVRDTLTTLLGDGCSGLDCDGFSCDAFRIDTTATQQIMYADHGGMFKSYNATVNGRNTSPATQQEES